MNDAELNGLLAANCAWWRKPQGWEQDDPDLRHLRSSPLDYEPEPLNDIAPDRLYVLRGPRRVGKSVEIKRMIGRLVVRGVTPRRIIHFSCDGFDKREELRQLVRVGRDQATRGITEPRYWFLDEITTLQDWHKEIKWLRDNTDLGQDCVVLSGSSARDLSAAQKNLAGRRRADVSDRLLLPMTYRQFVKAMNVQMPELDPVRPKDFHLATAEEALQELQAWASDLQNLWEVYCRCGGFPLAVASQLATGDVAGDFVRAIWDVIGGDALSRRDLNGSQVMELLLRLSKGLCSPLNISALGEDVGVDDKTAAACIADLTDAFLAWPCYVQGDHNRPNQRAQRKVYFSDPLIARIAFLRDPSLPEPNTTQITEQQLGLALIRALDASEPGRFVEYSSVMHARSATRSEVDFVGSAMAPVAFESKYSDRKLRQESRTLRALSSQGVIATHATLLTEDGVLYAPVSYIAYLLN